MPNSNSNDSLATFTTSAPCQYHRGHALTIYNLSLMHDGGQILFSGAGISLPHGSISGLVGTNGAGKSSLAQLLASKALEGFPTDMALEYLAAADDADNHYEFDSLEQAPRDYIQFRLRERLDQLRQTIVNLEKLLEEADPDVVEQTAEELSDLYDQEESMVERMQRETDHAMAKVGLQVHAHKRLVQLSCGWRYTCRLIAAVLTHPDGLIIDEPSFLDVSSTEWLMQQLKRMIKTENTIIILISHKEVLLETFCDRILHINAANQTLVTYNCTFSNFKTTLESSIQHASKTIHETQDKLKAADNSLKKVQAVCKKREGNLHKATRQGEGKNKEAKQRADKSAASKLHTAKQTVAHAEDVKAQNKTRTHQTVAYFRYTS